MLFKRNIQFSRLIKADGGMKEFNFRRPNGPEGEWYHVDVSIGDRARIYFSLKLEQESWKLQDSQLPSWVIEAEPFLQEAIALEELRFLPSQ